MFDFFATLRLPNFAAIRQADSLGINPAGMYLSCLTAFEAAWTQLLDVISDQTLLYEISLMAMTKFDTRSTNDGNLRDKLENSEQP